MSSLEGLKVMGVVNDAVAIVGLVGSLMETLWVPLFGSMLMETWRSRFAWGYGWGVWIC